ncbi:Calcium-binding protein [Aureococcus anophagefferens]|uniref:Calcium-binding protein n=1 Tax=Aureococcus anophagefferens TaxID=44056 RepID=A0ABR1GDD2_AURAN
MPKRSSQTTKSKNPLADLGDFDFHALWDDINGGGASKEPAAPAKAAPAKAAPAKAAPAKAKRASLGINSSLRTLFGGSADKARGARADRRPSLGVSSSVRKLFGAREKAPDAAPRRGSLSSSMKNLFEKRPSAADGRPALKRRGSSMRRRSSMSALLGTDTLHHKSQKAGHLSANLIGEYRAIFAACDTDGNGTLDAEEVKGALSRAGQKCSDAEVQSLIGEVDKNGDGVVDFAEFVRLLAIHDEASHEHQDKVQALATLGEGKLRRQSTRVLSADQVAHYSDLFDSFDIDGNGGIDVQELFHGLRGHRGGVTLADCRRYMAKVPQDDDGCIALPEFLQIIAMQEIVKGGVGNLIVEQTKASLNTQKYLSHAKVLEVEALFARADDDKNGLLEHHELLDALNENARGKKPSKFLNELRFAFATSDRRGPRGTQIFNPTSMCA